ncbi:putative zinc-finger-containing protein [Mycena sanguinolenta]|nr:putative zinc-finger-containing protein [Mycena sanguinolenta]
MPSFEIVAEECYCAICDLYFSSLEQRAEHIQESEMHPECDYCKRRYLNKNTLRNHYIYSKHHHYCASCQIEFKTPSGLRYHIEHAPVHCDDSDDEEGYNNEANAEHGKSGHFSLTEWEDEMGLRIYPDECESGAHSAADDSEDDSWEAYDDYDYDDAEDLGSSEEELENDSSEDEEEEGDDDENVVAQFSCPMCEDKPNSVACTPCGHLFCSPCITSSLKHTKACPVCSEAGAVEQLRKIFLA